MLIRLATTAALLCAWLEAGSVGRAADAAGGGEGSDEGIDAPAEVMEAEPLEGLWTAPHTADEYVRWAKAELADDRPELAQTLLMRALEVDPDHAEARRLLGYVRGPNGWLTVAEALAEAREDLKWQRPEEAALLADDVLQVASDLEDRCSALEVLGEAHVRLGRWEAAKAAYGTLASLAPKPQQATRARAVVSILTENPDGMYLVTRSAEGSSPFATPGGGMGKPVEVGFESLRREEVMQLAQRDRARAMIDRGQQALLAAKERSEAQPAEATELYKNARQLFEEANALVGRIARSYVVEVARGQIGIVENRIEEQLRHLDRMWSELRTAPGGREEGGDRPMAPQEFSKKLAGMQRSLEFVKADLQQVVDLGRDYEYELAPEMDWAEGSLVQVDIWRDVIADELERLGEGNRAG